MQALVLMLVGFLVVGGPVPSVVQAQQKGCPPEVAQAQSALKSAQASLKTQPAAKDVQAPRSPAGARTQEVNAPRTQEVNAPRTQEVNAPRTQEVNAPRTQEVNAPRTQDVNAPRTKEATAARTESVKKAEPLVRQAESACKSGDMAGASLKAKQALAILK